MNFTDNVRDVAKVTKDAVLSSIEMTFAANDIRSVIRADHRLVQGMIDELLEESMSTDHALVMEMVNELRNELLLHAHVEEAVLYEACKRHNKNLKDFVQVSCREHALIESLLDRMMFEHSGKNGELQASVKVLRGLVDQHLREEEGELFFRLGREFETEQLLDMGLDMETMKLSYDVPGPMLGHFEAEHLQHH